MREVFRREISRGIWTIWRSFCSRGRPTQCWQRVRAQLLAAQLNLANGSHAWQTGTDITLVIAQAIEFLDTHTSPVRGGHPDRQEALALKDHLDRFNNSGKGNCEAQDNDGNGDDGQNFREGAFTIGYWKNHETHLASLLKLGAIELGGLSVSATAEALAVLSSGNAVDMRHMLRAQLLAARLNLLNGAGPMFESSDIQTVVNDAVAFLASHTNPVTSDHPDRALAESLKNTLDAFNNRGQGSLEIVKVGKGPQSRVSVLWSGKRVLKETAALPGSWTDVSSSKNQKLLRATNQSRFFLVTE